MGADSEFIGSMSVTQFNPATGVLNSIDLILNCAYSSEVTVSGPDGTIGNFIAEETTFFRDPGNNIDLKIGNDWTGVMYGLPVYTHGGSTSPGEIQPSYNNPVVLSEFTGLGAFSLQDTGVQDVFLPFPAPPDVTVNITDGIFFAHGSVTYNYTARVADEGSSAFLLAMSFGLMIVARKALRKEYRAGSAL